MLPAGLRGFASRVGRLALRAFAWNKGGAESCAATSATAARTTRSARTLLRALLAMILAAATLLAMLILPPVNKAKGIASGDRGSYFTNPYPQVWWDGMGTGYAVGNGDANKYSENGNTYHPAWYAYNSISLPNATIDKTNRTITWTVSLMKESKEYQSIEKDNRIEGDAQGKGKPLSMIFLPKGIDLNSISIDRRRTGNKHRPDRNFKLYGCWLYNKDWSNKWGGKPGDTVCGNKAKTDVGLKLSDFYGTDNWYSTDANKVSSGFDQAFGIDKLGECSDEDNNGAGMCTFRSWKTKLSAAILSWEREGLHGYEWHITAKYNADVKHPELLPFVAGYIPNKYALGSDNLGGEAENARWAFMGPLDYDGDGIPDKIEHDMGTNPVEKTPLLYPKYDNKMLPDYIKKLKNQSGASAYGGISNVPVTVFGTNAELKPYVETGEWVGNTGSEGHFKKHPGETTTNIPISDLPGEDGIKPLPDKASMRYEIQSVPDGVSRSDYSGCNVSSTPGCVSVDRGTGVLKYNPRKKDIGHELIFTLKVHHPNSNIYPYWCAHGGDDGHWDEYQQVKIKVVSQASIYNPHYDETVVHNIKQGNGYYTVGTATSAEPKSVSNGKNWIMDGPLPKGTKFELKDYDSKKYPYAPKFLKWSNISKDNTNNGKVTFTPDKSNVGQSYSTPVLVTYPDGSTSRDPDAGNNGSIVAAPVRVEDLTVTSKPQDLTLKLLNGKSIDNNAFGGDINYHNASNQKPRELTKGQAIGKGAKDDGIVLDSWSTNAKGPITFRAVCHRKDDLNAPYTLLTPNGGKGGTPSGDVDGLQFQGFRQWIRDNDPKCANGNCTDGNQYLSKGEWNSSTMERSRALIGGTPKKAGEYECKVFAFHEAHTGAGKQYNGALKTFDGLVKQGANYGFAFDIGNTFASTRGTQWTVDSFHFKIKLKDNQKYNPTYVKMPTIEAGRAIKDKNGNKVQNTDISTDQPKSTKGGNGVPLDEQDGIVLGNLPPGTWFEIKRFVKASEVKNENAKTYPWSRFEDSEDNVTRDKNGDPVRNKGKVVLENEKGREYGSVTFRPDKWQDAGDYWAEVRVHYPDGTTSDGEHSVNEHHPVYAKVKVTAKPGNNVFGLDLYKTQSIPGEKISVKNGIDLHPGDLLTGDKRPVFDSYLTNAIGNLHQHMICSKQDKNGNQTDYTYGTLPGHVNNEKSKDENEKDGLRLLEPQTIWKHSSLKDQLECNADSKKCKSDTHLYDDWVDGNKSGNTFERTHGSFGGKAQKTGDYVCKVYVIKGDKESDAFKKAVESKLKFKKNEDPVPSVLNAKGNPYGTEGVGYKTGAFSVHIHNDNHFYNPKYVDVNVTAGQKVENAVPQSVKRANGADKYQDAVKAGALPDGTWFEFKDATHGFEVNANGTAGNMVSLDWSYWAGNAADKAGDQSNKPDNPKDPNNHKGKHSANGDGARYGKVTFHPDQSVAPKSYFKEIVIHYPDGSTSDNPDSGNNGKPVYAKVTVSGLGSGADKDLKMTLLRSQDADPIHDTLDSANPLTVMSGTSLTKNPYVLAWSLKDRSNISLRMMCTKQGEQKWSRGLDDTLNMHLNQNYGEGVQPWKFATADQRKSCSQDSKNCMANLLYGFTKDGKKDGIESAVSRSEDDIAGVPQKAGKYTCAVFALKPNALKVFDNTVNGSLIEGNKYSSTDMKKVQLTGLSSAVDWNRISFDVNVIDPPKFALPKTGGMNWNMLMSVVCVLGTGAMAAGFFLDQTKWGRAMLEALLRKTLIKDFICKTAKKLRALRRRSERWRC